MRGRPWSETYYVMKKLHTKSLTSIALLAIGALLIAGCDKDDTPAISLKTTNIVDITGTSAVIEGQVTSSLTINQKGVCWGLTPDPTIDDSFTNEGEGSGDFASAINNLLPDTSYFVRVYAIDAGEVVHYSSMTNFSTGKAEVMVDIDGNAYEAVTIGDQVWSSRNLKVKSLNDGSSIPNVTGSWSDLDRPAYTWYDNNDSNENTYGVLYNGVAIQSGKLCPTGWHVPSVDEWEALGTFLGGRELAGGKLKETGTLHWDSPNEGATDDYDFQAIGSGIRNADGTFGGYKTSAWWASSKEGTGYGVVNTDAQLHTGSNPSVGVAIRCIKDNE